jgi:hypothetical protein
VLFFILDPIATSLKLDTEFIKDNFTPLFIINID